MLSPAEENTWLALHMITHNRFTFCRLAKVFFTPTDTCIPACNAQHDNSDTCNVHSCIFLLIMLKPAQQHELKSSFCPSYDDANTRCFCMFNQLIVYSSTPRLDQDSRARSACLAKQFVNLGALCARKQGTPFCTSSSEHEPANG